MFTYTPLWSFSPPTQRERESLGTMKFMFLIKILSSFDVISPRDRRWHFRFAFFCFLFRLSTLPLDRKLQLTDRLSVRTMRGVFFCFLQGGAFPPTGWCAKIALGFFLSRSVKWGFEAPIRKEKSFKKSKGKSYFLQKTSVNQDSTGKQFQKSCVRAQTKTFQIYYLYNFKISHA